MADLPAGFEREVAPQTTTPGPAAPAPEGFVLQTPEVLAQIANNKRLVTKIDKALMSIPGVPTLTEFASGFNRSALGMLDFFGPDVINDVLAVAGSQKRIPTALGTAQRFGIGAPRGSFAGPGITTDIAASAGEVVPVALSIGQLFRSAAQQLPELAAASDSAIAGMFSNPLTRQKIKDVENTVGGVVRQLGTTTPAQDLGYGVASAAGAEVGEELGGPVGALIGSIFAPLSVAGISSAFRSILSRPQGVVELAKSLQNMSDEGAAALLADVMVRESMTPDDVLAALANLGPNAIPADVTNGFARLLKASANAIPRIEGRATDVLDSRQAGQVGRLASGLDNGLGVPGLSVDDEIIRLQQATKPEITALYDEAARQPLSFSGTLRTLLTGKNSLGDAYKAGLRRVADKRAAGDTITNFSVIDATKQQLDDEIRVALRAGEKNRARDLIRLKNLMVAEADAQIPGYKEARGLFAGQAALESAAEQGQLFLGLSRRELQDVVQTMGESELRMFRLGAKQGLFDKIDDITIGADVAKKLFGKNGDIAKLDTLFADPKAFESFRTTMEQEANFALTRRALTGSSTMRQGADLGAAQDVISGVRAGVRGLLGDPTALAEELPRIIKNVAGKKGSAAYLQSMEKAGDILLESGIDPARLQAILRAGDAPRIQAMLRALMPPPLTGVGKGIMSTGAGVATPEAAPMLAPQTDVPILPIIQPAPTAPPQARVQPTASPAARGLPFMTNQQAAVPMPPQPAPASPQARQMLAAAFPNDAILQAATRPV